MDYVGALELAKGSLTTLQVDLLSALCVAPGNALSAGQIARLLGVAHHAAVNSAIVRLAKALTKAANVEPPKRADGSSRWWHVVAEGEYSADGSRFFWRLRPALREAVIAVGICPPDDTSDTDWMETSDIQLHEGALRVIRVNA
jgi:predicted HNH restriction endonuclease